MSSSSSNSVAAVKCWPIFTAKHLVLLLLLALMVPKIQAQGQVPAQVPRNIPSELGSQSEALRSEMTYVTKRISSEIQQRTQFCVLDKETDWDRSFNFSNWNFLNSCMTHTPDVRLRLCTEAEIRAYFSSFAGNGSVNIQANANCNFTTFIPGCEPGWACSTRSVQQFDFQNNNQGIPERILNCKPCCEGFFCPEGLTCMMPCPLGSYCETARLNDNTGFCEPYNYHIPRGRNHTCGGANIWADFENSEEMFCPAGFYCPTTTEKRPCDRGHYCRTGSTLETRCSKLISCKARSEEQDIQAYGVMVIIALVALLLIIYNFSDHIISLREQRRARYRESAARSVQQHERALARWKHAKEAIKKQAVKLHASVSRRFSPRSHPEQFHILRDIDVQEDAAPISTNIAGNSSDLQSLSMGSEGSVYSRRLGLEIQQQQQQSQSLNPNRLGLEIEGKKSSMGSEGSVNSRRLGIEIEGKSLKKKVPKDKEIKTNTQIFEYAYAQIEKEKYQKRQFENMTFTGVISMATGDEIKKRPLVEVCFKDLTLTLKGKKRCLLKCLNGKLLPGRVTAVMGPSGAGKTTLMSALAGKESGCRKSGIILINGKPESIHSYRKIVGFVPQDDIVHGNLTVEENLRFSAWCRLPTNLSRADKVLIIERVLMNLGLQEVRDSLVGTVEKRGISGGQRKRVNVGLEMVIEPSILFLDEPTSGLDSSSSQLLLKALKHETLAGVNICMVVHQPSYALFRKFDDLILLAKGGLMVYQGSIRQVEEYFEGFGINVPERVNPPDYYIDILEGMVEPSQSSSINYKDLPLRWMLYKGYTVPEDMQSRAAELGGPQRSESTGEVESFTEDLWHDLRNNVEQQRDHMHHYVLRQKDLANRTTPGVIRQYKYFLGRITKQRLREARLQAVDYLILLVAGGCLGGITNIRDSDFGAGVYTFTIIATSLLCQIAALKTFSLDKLQYLRESASGISSLAHFLAKDTVDHFNTLIKPAMYLSLFYYITNPRSTFVDNYIVLVCLVYCVTGIGYAFAIVMDPGPAQLFSVLVPVCFTLISSQSLKKHELRGIANLMYSKWALEAFVLANAKRFYGVWLINRCAVLKTLGYDIHDWKFCIMMLIVYGLISRVIAFISLLIIRKK